MLRYTIWSTNFFSYSRTKFPKILNSFAIFKGSYDTSPRLLILLCGTLFCFRCLPNVQKSAIIFGSGYRTIDGSLNLKPYSTISCKVTVIHEENAVGLVETY